MVNALWPGRRHIPRAPAPAPRGRRSGTCGCVGDAAAVSVEGRAVGVEEMGVCAATFHAPHGVQHAAGLRAAGEQRTAAAAEARTVRLSPHQVAAAAAGESAHNTLTPGRATAERS